MNSRKLENGAYARAYTKKGRTNTFSQSLTSLKEDSRAAIKFTSPDRVPDEGNGWNITQTMLL